MNIAVENSFRLISLLSHLYYISCYSSCIADCKHTFVRYYPFKAHMLRYHRYPPMVSQLETVQKTLSQVGTNNAGLDGNEHRGGPSLRPLYIKIFMFYMQLEAKLLVPSLSI